jgi:shikimate dehydrogenase
MEYGLIGEHLPHSFSKIIHEKLAPYSYELHELRPDEVDSFMRGKEFKGINVTIPYKQTVIPYLDEISDQARSIGAVNTVVNRNRLFGRQVETENRPLYPCLILLPPRAENKNMYKYAFLCIL